MYGSVSKVSSLTAIVLVLLSLGAVLVPVQAAAPSDASESIIEVTTAPTRAGNGPIVNRTVIIIQNLYENFNGIDDFLYMTGKGDPYDIFFDPNYQWKEGGGKNDLPYGVYAFSAEYPAPYDEQTTPIKLSIIHYYQDTNFGLVTLQKARDGDFNYEVYGEEFFIIKFVANNRSGRSEAELRIKVLPVNDAPERISDLDFFSIWLNEDSTYVGVNKDNDQPNAIFGDKRDPFDTLTYSFTPASPLANNITVTMNQNGTGVLFRPLPHWCCPYLNPDQRLKGDNFGKGWDKYFAYFHLNVSDQTGAHVLATLYVYVAPQNDVPTMEGLGFVKVDEGALCTIKFRASDLDLPYEQELVFYTNATDSIYERTGIQVIYQSEYDWDRENGALKFRTDNEMVGNYSVSASVRDRSTRENGAPYDYPNSPYQVYANFTLSVLNRNDPPFARIDSPIETFEYNTSSRIEFNGTRSADMDIIHGEVLNYTWYKDGYLFGYGKLFSSTITSEGFYNITLNVTDGEEWSLDHVDIIVRKAKVLGEIFEGKDLERAKSDNSTPVVLWQKPGNPSGSKVVSGGQHSLDITSITGKREVAIYKINVMFAEPLQFLFTDEVRNEPVLHVFFLKPDFEEAPVVLSQADAATYRFPDPAGNYRYSNGRMEFDLSVPQTTYPVQTISPRIRMFDNRMGVEIILTIVEMDLMDVKPEFVLYAVVEMKTTISTASGTPVDIVISWDSAGYGTKAPQVSDIISGDDNGDGSKGTGAGLIIAIVVIILVFLTIVGLVAFLLLRKKPSKPAIAYSQPEPTVDELVFGQKEDQYAVRPSGPGYAGAPVPSGGALATPAPLEQMPPATVPEQLPPAQPVQPPPTEIPPQALPAAEEPVVSQ